LSSETSAIRQLSSASGTRSPQVLSLLLLLEMGGSVVFGDPAPLPERDPVHDKEHPLNIVNDSNYRTLFQRPHFARLAPTFYSANQAKSFLNIDYTARCNYSSRYADVRQRNASTFEADSCNTASRNGNASPSTSAHERQCWIDLCCCRECLKVLSGYLILHVATPVVLVVA
jgi:hypothetical protein